MANLKTVLIRVHSWFLIVYFSAFFVPFCGKELSIVRRPSSVVHRLPSRPVGAFDAVEGQVRIGQLVARRANLTGLQEAHLTIGEQVVPRPLPAPPAGILLNGDMIALPFADENLARRPGDVGASLGHGRLRVRVRIGRSAHRVDLLRAVIERHRVGVAGGFVLVARDAVLRAVQHGGIIRVDMPA